VYNTKLRDENFMQFIKHLTRKNSSQISPNRHCIQVEQLVDCVSATDHCIVDMFILTLSR